MSEPTVASLAAELELLKKDAAKQAGDLDILWLLFGAYLVFFMQVGDIRRRRRPKPTNDFSTQNHDCLVPTARESSANSSSVCFGFGTAFFLCLEANVVVIPFYN